MRLTKIYTRTGDSGKTRLANGEEVSKDSLRVSAYGDIDELNSLLGVVLTQNPQQRILDILTPIQHILFDIGGELASAGMITGLVPESAIDEMEKNIDDLNKDLPALEEFILPGGAPVAASLHLTRTVCRRAERSIISLDQTDPVAPELIKYVNRLSDLLFVMARFENCSDDHKEIYWKNPRK